MRIIILTLLFLSVVSCKKKEKIYYPNGSIKRSVGITNSTFHGSYEAFYEDGEMELQGNYENGSMQGMFIYYYKSKNDYSRSEILFHNDTAYYRKDFNKSGKLISEGPVHKTPNAGYLSEKPKIGKWKYYDHKEAYLKEVREFFYIDKNVYLNQNWILNKNKDTIGGHYYKFRVKDTLDLENQVIHFRLERPYFEDSTLFVCLPRKNSDKGFNADFSNDESVQIDTIENLSMWYEKLNQNKFQENIYDVVIDLSYDNPGRKLLRGFLLEKKLLTEIDTLDYDFVTRKIYFQKEIFIRDMIN